MNKNNDDHIGKLVIIILLVAIVFMSIGFAVLSTALQINGTATIKSAKWEIKYTNVNVKSGSVTAIVPATIESNNQVINYNIELDNIGDYYEFDVVIKNNGTLDAEVESILKSGVSTAQDVYVNYVVTGMEIGDVLASGQTSTVRVRVELDPDITETELPTDTQNMSLTFAIKFIQA